MLIVFSGAARAQAQDDGLSRAREAFDKGQILFETQKYVEAAAQFESAYQAKAFAQFLFNIAACHEKANDYGKAIDFYRKYVLAAPEAPDKEKTEKRIAVLEKAVAENAAKPADPANPQNNVTSQALTGLDQVTIKGVVSITSTPQGAYIYLDDKKNKPLGRTPWAGELEGSHTVFVEREGYKPAEERMTAASNKLVQLIFALSEEDYLGWVEITSNVAGAAIYLDNKNVGVYKRTPFAGNLPPGKHKIWVTQEGYNEHVEEINVVAGKTHKVNAELKGAPVGYLNVRGRDVEKTAIWVDGKVLCERGPCRKPLPSGVHKVTIKREDYKSYSVSVDMQAKTEVTVKPTLAPEPSRVDAYVAYAAAGLFLGTGVWAGMKAKSLKNDLQDDINAGDPPPDRNDSRFTEGKVYSIVADSAYVLGGISLLGALYYTFRDKGDPSTGTTDIGAMADGSTIIMPTIGLGYAGFDMEVRF